MRPSLLLLLLVLCGFSAASARPVSFINGVPVKTIRAVPRRSLHGFLHGVASAAKAANKALKPLVDLAAPIERKVLPAEEQALKPVEVAQAELAPAEQYALGGLEAAQAYLVPAEDAVQSVLYPLETAALSELITAQEALNPYEGVALNEVGPAISFLEKNTFNALKKAQAAALPVEKVVLGGLEAAQAYSLPYEEVVVGVVPLVVKEVALFGENTAYPLILDVQSYSLPVEEAALGVLDIAAGAIVPAVEPIGAAAVKPATTLQEAALPVETAAGTPALGALTTTGEAVASFLDVQNIGH